MWYSHLLSSWWRGEKKIIWPFCNFLQERKQGRVLPTCIQSQKMLLLLWHPIQYILIKTTINIQKYVHMDFSNASKRPTLTTETLLMKHAVHCFIFLLMRGDEKVAALLSVRLPKLSHHDNKGSAKIRRDKRLWNVFNATSKKLRNAVKLIVVRLRHAIQFVCRLETVLWCRMIDL